MNHPQKPGPISSFIATHKLAVSLLCFIAVWILVANIFTTKKSYTTKGEYIWSSDTVHEYDDTSPGTGFICGVIAFISIMYWSSIIDKRNRAWIDHDAERLRMKRAEEAQQIRAEEDRRSAEAEQRRVEAEKAEIAKAIIMSKEFTSRFIDYVISCLIIDSNIWMKEEYDTFFEALLFVCKANKLCLSFYGPQFDEITNIKKKADYGEEKNHRARLAINRIEEFQVNKCLRIEAISIDSNPRAYADPLIIKLLTTESKKGKRCIFISDDKELRIRVREHVYGNSHNTSEIISGEDLIMPARTIIFARNNTISY